MNLRTPDTLTLEQRARIISEIEAMIHNQRAIEGKLATHDIDETIETFAALNPTALTSAWGEIVGQYILTAPHLDDSSSCPEAYVEYQWERLLEGDPRDYQLDHVIEIEPKEVEQAAQAYSPEDSRTNY